MSNHSFKCDICLRVGQIRRELHGNRGKVRFAKQLGISPSTYNYYETTRIPPAEILVRIADAGGVDLRWLLGEESSPAVRADHPTIARIAELLAGHPDAARPLTAFVDILSQSFSWPAKPQAGEAKAGEPQTVESQGVESQTVESQADSPVGQSKQEWIPILGRSAAGVPQFWADDEDADGVTLLSDLVDRYARRSVGQVADAVAGDETGKGERAAQIITMTAPEADSAAEFVVAGTVKRKYPDAFAVRIDGDSMVPAIRHGDVVICSASAPAEDASAAVVQLAGQIGVTCKVFRRDGDTVHLIPINEQYAPQSFSAETIVWARRVLAQVRPG